MVKEEVSVKKGKTKEFSGVRPSGGFWPTDKTPVPKIEFDFRWVYYPLAIVLVIFLIWFFIFNEEVCESWTCFNDNLKSCSGAEFIGGISSGVVYKYSIDGVDGDWCRVDVKLLQADMNNQDSRALEGKEMYCLIPKGSVSVPESNIKYCHGELREGLQDLVVNKLYAYIVDNMGVINYDLLEIPASAINQSRQLVA